MIDSRAIGRQRRNGVFGIFFITGVALATWLARLPALRDNLELETFQVGLFLFGSGAGSLLGLTLSAAIIHRLGERLTMLVFAITAISGMGMVGVVSVIAPSLLIAIGTVFFFGLGMSVTDVAMNVEGARVERELSNQIMPWFHAMFSLGAVIGALIGTIASAQNIGVGWHFATVAVLLIPLTVWVYRHIPPNNDRVSERPEKKNSTRRELVAAWREPRTLAIGLVALGMAFAEGSATDWLALGMTDDRGASNATAAAWFVLFTLAMGVGRVISVPLLDRYGRVGMLSAASVAAVTGLALLITVDNTVTAIIAVVLWGMGSSLGFPVAMSAAADDPAKGPVRVSVVATIAYAAFLVGPPLLGGLGQIVGILNSLWVVVGLIIIAFFAIPQTRKLDT